MCPPTHFDVTYAINPWMEPDKPTDAPLAVVQWERLRSQLIALGHRVDLVLPVPGLPDMVFAANAATVVGGRVLAARYRYPQRSGEEPVYRNWFAEHGYPVRAARFVNEGEGDFLVTGERILAGTGFRTERRAHDEAQEHLGLPVVGLTLVDPYFYHLDTALAVLDHETIMYYPGAFSKRSQAILRELYPSAIRAGRADAEVFGLNAVSDGRNVLLPTQATRLVEALRRAGFNPIGVDLTELLKAGGGAKCCTLELRERK
ncbi:MAG TPA: arginine deiminase-related protein [Actinophytocola sp.]|uniref:dimethylargininase n=1 Tax=Actinophytocola sp. TaxID=1872138 RepID=UPI002DBFEED9|nr:dimethylargininase [Actinophytocola sp.]HEU5471308.1 arginine deiminase-related protein [Actinophytocola sp.]